MHNHVVVDKQSGTLRPWIPKIKNRLTKALRLRLRKKICKRSVGAHGKQFVSLGIVIVTVAAVLVADACCHAAMLHIALFQGNCIKHLLGQSHVMMLRTGDKTQLKKSQANLIAPT